MRNYYKPGTWNCLCDVCGFKFKSDQLQQRWDGRMVCAADFETRHPQDLLRTRAENLSVPWTRTEPADSSTEYMVSDTSDPLVTDSGDNIVW